MYPTFCSYAHDLIAPDPYFERVSAQCGLGAALPGLALGDVGNAIRAITSVDGRESVLPRDVVRLGLSEGAALALMDAVEEAIEDAYEAVPRDRALLERMEATLLQFESMLPAD